MTPTQIVLGATGPLSGPAAQYKPVLTGAKAYFDYVNAHGGVTGERSSTRSRTTSTTRRDRAANEKLVEQDDVFAIFNSVGTEHALAVREYLNQKKVPQLFLGSGAATIAHEHGEWPWSIALLPSFGGEGAIYGRLIAKEHPNAKIGVLYEDDEYGNELLGGLKRGLARRRSRSSDAVVSLINATVDATGASRSRRRVPTRS